MPTQPVPDTAQLTYELLVDSQTIFQTFYFEKDGGWNETNLDALATLAQTGWDTDFKPLFTAAVTLTRIVATDLTNLNSARFVKPVSPVIAGTEVGDYLPLNAALAIHLDIGNRGRGRNGRTFWPALTEAETTGNQVQQARAAAIVAAITSLQASVEADLLALMCIIHRTENKVKLPAGVPYPVSSISVRDLNVDTQKDRLPRHKRKKLHSATPV